VICIGKFNTEEEAISLANDTKYGLGAAVYSSSGSQCLRVSSAIAAGTVSGGCLTLQTGSDIAELKVWINQYGLLNVQSPFGGYRMSGVGRELGSYALAEYTEVKSVLWNVSESAYWPL
jgi:aldehyde dehydrogenase (NAD+)